MNTIDLAALQNLTQQAQKLQTILREIAPLIELIKTAQIQMPTDRLIRANEAADILGVNKSTISAFVKAGLLTPLYVNSEQRKFWLSQVRALPRKKPWTLKDEKKLCGTPNDLFYFEE